MQRTPAPPTSSTIFGKFHLKSTAWYLFLTAFCTLSHAELVQLAEDDIATVYADTEAIVRSGETVKIWALYDYKNPTIQGEGVAVRSARVQNEFDCKENRRRTLYYTNHTGQMGAGESLSLNSHAFNWRPIPAKGPLASLKNVACGVQ